MKTSFSTVGCPRWRWSEITSCAADMGFDGIELRGIGEDLTLTEVSIFKPENVDKTYAGLQKAGLTIPCLASDCLIYDPGYDISGVHRYLALSRALHAPTIRLLCDQWGWPGDGIDRELVKARLTKLAPEAERQGVLLLVESNGIWAKTDDLRRLIESVNSPAVQVLWDINHPAHYYGESAAESFANIGRYVRHVHLKDSLNEDGRLVYKMLGYGELPLREALALLHQNGYEGYLSMEWVKRWNEELEDAGIVFAHYIYQVKKMLAEVQAR